MSNMFCGNCGNQLKESERFCGNCGFENKNEQEKATQTNQQMQTNYKKKLILSFNRNKKPLIFAFISIILIIISVVSFISFYNPFKILWDEEKSDLSIDYTEPAMLNYKVQKVIEKASKDKVKWKVSGGKIIKVDLDSVVWQLPEKKGKYTITASFRNKKISDSVNVVEKEQVYGIVFDEIDPLEDEDGDGLNNKDEQKYGTDMYNVDTDKDGITDYYEINISKTNPLKYDSDEDGLSDGDELVFGFDPLKADTKGDGIKDGQRQLTYSLKNSNVELIINGTGDLATSTIDILSNNDISEVEGVLDNVYQFKTNGNMKNATVTITYNKQLVLEKGLNEENLNIYYFDSKDKSFEKINSKIDLASQTLTANIDHFSMYVIADETKIKPYIETEIFFVIDNSGSMYPKSSGSETSEENDVDFKRVDLSISLINKLAGSYKFGVGKFTFSYSTLSSLTDNKKKAIDKINSIKTSSENFNGTYIGNALYEALNQFKSDNKLIEKYIILLTDGDDTKTNPGYDNNKMKKAINIAKEKSIKIVTIGLGKSVNKSLLLQIANETGGKYYHANSADILNSIYNQVFQDINYNFIDTDGDDKVDSVVLADSGFDPMLNGFSFNNFKTDISGGSCSGFAALSQLYYQNKLPKSQPSFISKTKISAEIPGYNITNIDGIQGENLYNFNINQLKLLSNERSQYIQKVEKKGTKYYLDENREYLKNVGYDFKISNNNEEAILNLRSDNFNNNVVEREKELIKAIHWYWANQTNYKRLFIVHYDDSMNRLIEIISNKIPVYSDFKVDKILGGSGLGNGHAVNIFKISQNVENPNSFNFHVYDNNYFGQTRYMNVERIKLKMLDPILTNSEYSYHVSYEYKKGEYNTSNIYIYNLGF